MVLYNTTKYKKCLRQVIVADALKVIKICDLVKLSEQETYQKKTVLKLQLRLFTDFFAQVNLIFPFLTLLYSPFSTFPFSLCLLSSNIYLVSQKFCDWQQNAINFRTIRKFSDCTKFIFPLKNFANQKIWFFEKVSCWTKHDGYHNNIFK